MPIDSEDLRALIALADQELFRSLGSVPSGALYREIENFRSTLLLLMQKTAAFADPDLSLDILALYADWGKYNRENPLTMPQHTLSRPAEHASAPARQFLSSTGP